MINLIIIVVLTVATLIVVPILIFTIWAFWVTEARIYGMRDEMKKFTCNNSREEI